MIDDFAAGGASLSGAFRALAHGRRVEAVIYSIAGEMRGLQGKWVVALIGQAEALVGRRGFGGVC